jgi:hypothetical protein
MSRIKDEIMVLEMKFCVNCKHYLAELYLRSSPQDFGVCIRPYTDLVTGETKRRQRLSAQKERYGDPYLSVDHRFNICGRDGAFYEPH